MPILGMILSALPVLLDELKSVAITLTGFTGDSKASGSSWRYACSALSLLFNCLNN
jgi:hypothetical protein